MRDRSEEIAAVGATKRSAAAMHLPSFAFACVALLAYLAMNHLMVSDIVDHLYEREVYKSVIYGGWLLGGFMVLIAFVATAPRLVVMGASVVFLVSLATNYAYAMISKNSLSLDVMEWLPQEGGQFVRAWTEYGHEIVWATVKAAALLAVLLALRKVARRRELFATHHAGTRTGLLATGAFLAFHASATALQPPQMMAETNVVVFGLPALFASTPDLRRVPVKPVHKPYARKIVLAVDESVTYDVYRRVLASSVAKLGPVDFGEAASTANCSAASNALLRWGAEALRVKAPGYDPRTNPTIWAYARAAGFRTVLIDGQSQGALQNYMGRKEFALVDDFVPANTGIDSDLRIAEKVNALLRRPGADFIYVVKRGVHFPYEMSYPDDDVPAEAPRPEKYARAVSYSNHDFFSSLTRDIDLSDVLVIYTSDHGQDLTNRSTHCNPEPLDTEYSVPLVTVTRVPALLELIGNGERMRDRASHLNIFPTLLYAFGYGRDWLETEYGPTLAGPPRPYLVYVSLGWNVTARSKDRYTVDTTQFTESAGFPHRNSDAVQPDTVHAGNKLH